MTDLNNQIAVPVTNNEVSANAASVTANVANSGSNQISNQLPEIFKSKGWQNINDAVNAYQKLEIDSNNKLAIPTAEDKAAWQNLYQKLGRPEMVEDYNLTGDKNLKIDDNLQNWFKQTAFNSGLSSNQAQELFNSWNDYIETTQNQASQQQQQISLESIQKLKQEWGNNFDNHLRQAKQAVNHYNLSVNELDAIESALGSDNMIKLFEKIGAGLKEANFINNNSSNSGFGLDSHSAKTEMQTLMANKEFMAKYLNGDKEAISKIQNLMRHVHR